MNEARRKCVEATTAEMYQINETNRVLRSESEDTMRLANQLATARNKLARAVEAKEATR